MDLHISDLLPTYFDRSRINDSEIWGRSLSWQAPELIKIIAPSGSGKSSLINFLYGMRSDYSGSISYGGKSLRDFSVEELSRLRKDHISIVFQDMRLFPGQTVLQNLEIKRQLNPYEQANSIRTMTERLGIESKLNNLCSTCSYGEQQRVAIIRSLLQPFDFLLMDEPFSHLDNNNAEKAMELILEEARKRKACVIFADLERIDHYPNTKLYHL